MNYYFVTDSSVSQKLEGWLLRGADRMAYFLLEHWLLLPNVGVGILASLPVLAPLLKAGGYVAIADPIYRVYGLFCHQLPNRSFFIFGYQMAYCERDFAIYTAIFLGGLWFSRIRFPSTPLDWRIYVLLAMPMAIDGFTQLSGWRESNWQLRVVTGGLFGLASVWLIYPRLDRAASELRSLWDPKPEPIN